MQARVNELIGKEAVVGVVELGFQAQGTGGGIDLVIEGGEFTGGQ